MFACARWYCSIIKRNERTPVRLTERPTRMNECWIYFVSIFCLSIDRLIELTNNKWWGCERVDDFPSRLLLGQTVIILKWNMENRVPQCKWRRNVKNCNWDKLRAIVVWRERQTYTRTHTQRESYSHMSLMKKKIRQQKALAIVRAEWESTEEKSVISWINFMCI